MGVVRMAGERLGSFARHRCWVLYQVSSGETAGWQAIQLDAVNPKCPVQIHLTAGKFPS